MILELILQRNRVIGIQHKKMDLTYEYLQKLGQSLRAAVMNSKLSQCWEWLAF